MEGQKLLSLTKKDFEIQTFRSGGKGGQHQNKTDSGVRIIHKATGLSGESRKHRSQLQNKKEAFYKLCEDPKFKSWIKIESSRIAGTLKTPEQIKEEVNKTIERDLENGNIKIEYY